MGELHQLNHRLIITLWLNPLDSTTEYLVHLCLINSYFYGLRSPCLTKITFSLLTVLNTGGDTGEIVDSWSCGANDNVRD